MYNKYSIEFRTDRDVLHSITLSRANSIAALTREMQIDGEGYTLERDTPSSLFEPLRTMRLELPILCDSNYQLEHITTDTREWIVELQINKKTIFKGVVEQSLHEEEYNAPPYTASLSAVCGLSRLADEYFALDTLKTNEKGLCSLDTILRHALRQSKLDLEIEYRDTKNIDLATLYIDPEMYRTSGEYIRNTEKASDVVSNLLRSLSLCIYQEGGKWIIERAAARPSGNSKKILDTSLRPFYNSASLSTEGAYGSVRINLAEEKFESLFRMPLPSFPLPTFSLPSHEIGRRIIKEKSLNASEGLTTKAPNDEQASKGVIAVIETNSTNNHEGRIAVRCPFLEDENITDIEVSIDLAFPEVREVDENADLQAVGYIGLGSEEEICFTSNYALPYNFLSNDATTKVYERGGEYNEKRETKHFDTKTQKGKHKEEYHSCLSSPFSSFAWLREEYKTHYTLEKRLAQFDETVRNNLTWSRVSSNNLRKGKMSTFSFKTAKLWRSTRFHDAQTRRYYGYADSPPLNTLYFQLPMRFWRVDKGGKNEQFSRIYPSKVHVGKIEIKYHYRDDETFDSFIVADRGGSFVREAEEIDLHLSTEIAELKQPATRKGQLLTAEGEAVRYLYDNTDIVQHTAKEFFSIHARTHDMLTVEMSPKIVNDLKSIYTLPTRPHKEYKIIGSIYTPAEQKEEITFIEITNNEEEALYE